jgi:hypothetical protein
MPVTAVKPVFSGNGLGEHGRQLLGADEKSDVSAPDSIVAKSGLHSHALSRMERLSRFGWRSSCGGRQNEHHLTKQSPLNNFFNWPPAPEWID